MSPPYVVAHNPCPFSLSRASWILTSEKHVSGKWCHFCFQHPVSIFAKLRPASRTAQQGIANLLLPLTPPLLRKGTFGSKADCHLCEADTDNGLHSKLHVFWKEKPPLKLISHKAFRTPVPVCCLFSLIYLGQAKFCSKMGRGLSLSLGHISLCPPPLLFPASPSSLLPLQLLPSFSYSSCICGARDWTHSLTHTKQEPSCGALPQTYDFLSFSALQVGCLYGGKVNELGNWKPN